MITDLNDCSRLLSGIDHFIFSILDGSSNDVEIRQYLIDTLPQLVLLEKKEWEYCPTVMIFFKYTADLIRNQSQYSNLGQLLSTEYIKRFKKKVLSDAGIIHDDIVKFKQAKQRNAKQLVPYLCKLFVHYHRLLLVRIDLGLKLEVRQYKTMYDFYEYLKTLRNRFANKDGCFQHLHGYLLTIEEGQEKGPHAHLLLFFSGDRHQDDYGLTCKIREYWQELTEGNGTLFGCNEKEYKAKMQSLGILGIGMISRYDTKKVFRAIHAAMYLTHTEKYSQRVKGSPMNMRWFATGQFKNKFRRNVGQTILQAQQLQQQFEAQAQPILQVRSG